jgi:Zn-dependent protease with chaperone function/Zn-finger nucleic acid-binding protein
MRTTPAPDFYEVQRSQWRKSLLVFAWLVVFYFAAIALISLSVVVSLGIFAAGPGLLSAASAVKLLLAVLGTAVIIAVFHYLDARRFGAAYIVKRLDAAPPEPSDRYHQQFADTVDEMRIASGLPKVKPYIIPSFAINSLALVEPDGVPAVAVTEGLLADCTRDELQAVAAHELAHISRGDAFYVTLVCSLANFLEKIQSALEPGDVPPEDSAARRGQGGATPVLVYFAAALSALVMRLFSMMLSREREVLADAAASEIGRNPAALARALYKAHVKSSFVGDFSLTYSPLFIVAPRLSSEDDEGFFSRVFNSHPPLMKRLRLLARMAGLEPANIIEQVWEGQKLRAKARDLARSSEELRPAARSGAIPGQDGTVVDGGKIWSIQDSQGRWQGPFLLWDLMRLPYFGPGRRVRNMQEDVEATAREFPQVRQAVRSPGRRPAADPARKNLCPRCRQALNDTFYEGVPIQVCGRCGGKLVDAAHVGRILWRRETDFSSELLAKAARFRKEFLSNPVKVHRSRQKTAGNLSCPSCGYRLAARPYSYQYFIPVDRCLACGQVWFDADELEVLQILVEKRA